MRFGLIGDGIIAKRHKEAIAHVGGDLCWISDPAIKIAENNVGYELRAGSRIETRLYSSAPTPLHYMQVDYVVICSPTYLHRKQAQEAVYFGKKVICEKPLCLPWEPLIDDDRINIVLQLRYIEELPKKADTVRAIMVRDDEFFKTWKGNPLLAGGNIYEFFIHYIDLAILLGADFEGAVYPEGKQVREVITYHKVRGNQMITTLDIMLLDMQELYNRMYADILNGGGVKPKDIFYLTWLLNRNSEQYGYRISGLNKMIRIPKELL
jgi:predicted dehydrogenase